MPSKGRSTMIILFDLEGTLVQSLKDYRRVLFEYGFRTREKLVDLGIPSDELKGKSDFALIINKGLEFVEKHFCQEEAKRFHRELDKFLKSYELCWADRSRVFPETLPVLNDLTELGWLLGLITNTSREAANRMLSMHHMETCFKIVITRDDVKRLKPDPEGIQLALRKAGVRDFFFVGDSAHDSGATKKAGGISIIVNRDRSRDMKFHADYIVGSMTEIPNLIKRLRASCYHV